MALLLMAGSQWPLVSGSRPGEIFANDYLFGPRPELVKGARPELVKGAEGVLGHATLHSWESLTPAETTGWWVVGALALTAIAGCLAAWTWRSHQRDLRQVHGAGGVSVSEHASRSTAQTPVAWGVLGCGVLLSVFGWHWSARHAVEHRQLAFATQVRQSHTILRHRLDAYEAILRSASRFAAGSLEAGRSDWGSFGQEWHLFVDSLRLQQAHPSLVGLGFHVYVPSTEQAEHVQAARVAGLAGYEITPAGLRSEYAPTLFFEPGTAQSPPAVGYDIFSDPVSREALEQARASGELILSHRLKLGAEASPQQTFGHMMVHPVYGPLGLSGWREGRREALRGYVSVIFRLEDFLGAALTHGLPGVELEMHEAPEASAAKEPPVLNGPLGRRPAQGFLQVERLQVGARVWNLVFRSNEQFDLAEHDERWGVLTSGLLLSSLLFGLLRVQGRARAQSQALVGRVMEELEERKRAEAEVRALSVELDERVARRTAALAASHSTLAETAARLRAIVEHEPECVMTVSLDGQLLELNPAGLAMIEAPNLEAVRSARVVGLVHPDDRRAFRDLHERVSHGEKGSLQFRMRSLRGQERWLESNSVPLRDAQGRIVSVLSVTRDITSRRAIEVALRALVIGTAAAAHADFFRTLVRSLAEAFGVRYAMVGQAIDSGACCVETVAVWANGAEAANFTYSLAGTPCAEVLAKGEALYSSGLTAQFPAGQRLAFTGAESYFGIALFDGQERLVGVMATMHDQPFLPTPEQHSTFAIFAARAGLELDRRRAEEILRESEERFRTLAETSPIGISRTDTSGGCTYNNRAWLEFTGQTFEESLGHGWANAVHPEDRERTLRDWLEVARQGGETTDELRILRPDGQIRWLRSRAKPLRDQDGHLLGHVGTHEDITDLKRAEKDRAFLESQLRQAQKLEAIGTLAGGIAHDFNNILGAIMGFTQVAKFDTAGQPQVQESLDAILQSSRRARDLVNRILAFSRQEESCRQPVPVGPIVNEVAKLLRATLPVSTDIQIHVAPDLPLIDADATQVHQVLMNLATNSAQALPEGRGRIEISASLVTLDALLAAGHSELQPGRYVCLSVRDNGRGMDKATAERAFDPFFTTKGPGKGTGLGLSVVHGIVKSHQGALRLTTALGQGATFDVFLPVLPTGPQTSAATELLAPPGRGQRILLVDDEPALVRVGQRALLNLGYVVTAYSDPLEALKSFRAQPREFDLLLTDLAMPQLSGTDFAREVLAERPDLPIVMTTGFGASVTPETARQLGIREILAKPAEIEELGAAVFRALRDVNDA